MLVLVQSFMFSVLSFISPRMPSSYDTFGASIALRSSLVIHEKELASYVSSNEEFRIVNTALRSEVAEFQVHGVSSGIECTELRAIVSATSREFLNCMRDEVYSREEARLEVHQLQSTAVELRAELQDALNKERSLEVSSIILFFYKKHLYIYLVIVNDLNAMFIPTG